MGKSLIPRVAHCMAFLSDGDRYIQCDDNIASYHADALSDSAASTVYGIVYIRAVLVVSSPADV